MLSGTRLSKKVDEVADDIRTRRAIENLAVLRGYTETRYKAKSWDHERRTVARIEATMLGLDIRFVVTRRCSRCRCSRTNSSPPAEHSARRHGT